MKLGGFGRIEDYCEISKAGYDYAELDMPEIEELPKEEFEQFVAFVQRESLPVLTGARILPVGKPLFFSDGFQPETLKPYLEKTCARAGRLGIKKVILGNGKARWFPEGGHPEQEAAFVRTLCIMAEAAAENGQELILEPLGPKYSNYINTIPEAVRVIEKVDMPNVFTMGDLRHMVWAKEDFSDLITYREYIHHIHIDYPLSYPERRYPSPEDGYDYRAFLDILEKSGYDDTLTVEADVPNDWTKAWHQVMALVR